jgi:LytS/YehU family sensor histidine kinase
MLYGANTVIIIFIASLILNQSETNTTIRFFQFLQTLSYALLFSYLIAGFYETRYFIYEWGKSFAEAEELKKLNLQIQIASLKNQINPHFLFNSLNTLSSLVAADKLKAGKFIDEMSNVYRYVLQNNEKDLIPLRDEIEFIRSFFDLLKTRYEEGILLEFDIEEQYLDYLLPPHTLQLLVENAVKHNVVSAKDPLSIKIYSDQYGQLIIENNVQQKSTSVKSNKMGLANIFAKYKLLSQPQVIINHTIHLFQVILPLIPAITVPGEKVLE